jgi:hypothetical protein
LIFIENKFLCLRIQGCNFFIKKFSKKFGHDNSTNENKINKPIRFMEITLCF